MSETPTVLVKKIVIPPKLDETVIIMGHEVDFQDALKCVLDTISKNNYYVGTNIMIQKVNRKTWGIFDLEDQILMSHKDLHTVVAYFVRLETPEVIINEQDRRDKVSKR